MTTGGRSALASGSRGPRRTSDLQPGRWDGHVPPAKPNAEETPWRSSLHVAPRHSADGNAYRVGEPIPEVEARRQGLVQARASASVRVARIVCRRCNGTGLRGEIPKGHRPGCGCFACGPCPGCGGSRFTDEGG